MYQTPSGNPEPSQRGLRGILARRVIFSQSVVLSSLTGWPSLVQQEQSQSCGLILRVQPQDGLKVEALFGEIVHLRCQPESGADCEGARTVGDAVHVDALSAQSDGGASSSYLESPEEWLLSRLPLLDQP